jgi:hypothetical protein
MPLSKQQLGSLLFGIADTGLRGKVEDLSLICWKSMDTTVLVSADSVSVTLERHSQALRN